ncbi:MAG: hypothetical protein KJZ65_03905 [Phycisphaerales bacterium]|nr:hypothetical protein [Phycisphaerales bacterium]
MLSDVFGNLRLDVFPTVGMVFFLVAFIAISWRAVRASRAEMDEAAGIPLHESDSTGSKGE